MMSAWNWNGVRLLIPMAGSRESATGSVVAAVVPAYVALNAAMALTHGCSEATNLALLALKVDAWAGSSAERSDANAWATAGIVFGSYHRCGLAVLSGSLSRCCTLIILRAEFGDAEARESMKVS